MENIVKHARPDYNGRIVDLAGLVPQDEPVLLVRGQDVAAYDTAMAYAAYAEMRGAAPELVMMAKTHANFIKGWQMSTTGRMKIPDLPPDDGARRVDYGHVLYPAVPKEAWFTDEDGETYVAIGRWYRTAENVMSLAMRYMDDNEVFVVPGDRDEHARTVLDAPWSIWECVEVDDNEPGEGLDGGIYWHPPGTPWPWMRTGASDWAPPTGRVQSCTVVEVG